MFVSHKALNERNLATNFCCRGKERKRRRMAEEEARAGTERLITDYGTTISPVISFKYLGGILLAADGEWA